MLFSFTFLLFNQIPTQLTPLRRRPITKMIPLLILSVVIALYYYSTKNFNYWSRRGVKFEQPIPVFGNHLKNVLGLRSDVQTATELYQKYKNEKIVGRFRGNTPELIIRDPEILKSLLVKDFQFAHSRFFLADIMFLMKSIYFSNGDPWRPLRAKLSAAFTTSNLKLMMPTLTKWSGTLENELKTSSNKSIDTYKFMHHHVGNMMGELVFDITDEEELKELKSVFSDFKMRHPYPALRDTFPKLSKFFQTSNKTEGKFVNIVKKAFDRRAQESKKTDILGTVLEMKNEGTLVGESVERDAQIEVKMNDTNAAAQLYTLFSASVDTLTMTLTCTLLELAHHEDIQDKILNDIDQLKEINFDSIEKLTSLDKVVKESMRLHTPGGIYQRVCNAKYEIPGTNVVIDPEVRIMIPAQALHLDEKYYKAPEEFRPSRFAEAEEKKRHPCVYLPFGAGPKKCIGERLARSVISAILVSTLRSHRVKPVSPRAFDYKQGIFMARMPSKDILLEFEEREGPTGIAG